MIKKKNLKKKSSKSIFELLAFNNQYKQIHGMHYHFKSQTIPNHTEGALVGPFIDHKIQNQCLVD